MCEGKGSVDGVDDATFPQRDIPRPSILAIRDGALCLFHQCRPIMSRPRTPASILRSQLISLLTVQSLLL